MKIQHLARASALAAAWLCATAASAQTVAYSHAGYATLSQDVQALSSLGMLDALWSFDGVRFSPNEPHYAHYDSMRVQGTDSICGVCVAAQLNFKDNIEVTAWFDPALRFVVTDLVLDIPSLSLLGTVAEGPLGVGNRYTILAGESLVGSATFSVRLDQPYVPLAFGIEGFKLGSAFTDLVAAGFEVSQPTADYVKTRGFGSLSVGSPAIPEPSTYSLMALGLVAAAWAARLRTKCAVAAAA